MNIEQIEININSSSRGFHLITSIIQSNIPQITNYKIGLLNLFLKHTSASLTINENMDPTVRDDLESHFNKLVPENQPYYKHTFEGPDDMPAHIKSSIIGNSLSIPISDGSLSLGTWQGIYLCEHRDPKQMRKVIATIFGER
tara:strand:+ start:138 stop:563 length:426 start_codon:yes stop_codon:yes gene_type:complete